MNGIFNVVSEVICAVAAVCTYSHSGRPLIVNERLVADEQNDGNIDNSISCIEGGLCAQLEVSERL